MSNIICVASERFGKLFRVKKEDFDIKKGDHVIIESELGGELAVVKNISGKVCGSSESIKDIVKIVSIATEDDIKKFAHQTAQFGYPMVLIPFEQPNTTNRAIKIWSGYPGAEYVDAWVRMHELFEREGANPTSPVRRLFFG